MKLKQYLLATALCLAPLAASAADLPRKAAPYYPPPPPPFSWTGFYIGASGGFISQDTSATDLGNKVGDAFWDVIGDHYGVSGVGGLFGGNIGYNYQFAGNWVIGIEADISWSGVDNSFTHDDLTVGSKLSWLGTVRGRIGYAFDRALLYGTGGFAYGHVENTAQEADFAHYNANTSGTRTGWTAGGGLEYAFLNNWTARVEALYVDLGTTEGQFTHVADVAKSGCRFGFKNRYTLARFGLNYKF